jgi:hypothetical protein
MAVIYKSFFDGRALYLSADSFQHLHPLAMNNYRRYEIPMLYFNDPNAKKVPFTTIEIPIISNYQTDQVDPEDATKTINYAEIYGEDPQVRCIIVVDAQNSYQLQQMPQFTYVAGLVDTIYFLPGFECSGRLIISKG